MGVWLLAIGGVLSGYAPGFGALLACRVLEGIGFGVMIAPPATLVMQWFDESRWPYMNMLNAVAPFLGLTAAFAVTGPLYLALGSRWRTVLLAYGLIVTAIAILWTLLGRTHPSQAGAGGGHVGVPALQRISSGILSDRARPHARASGEPDRTDTVGGGFRGGRRRS